MVSASDAQELFGEPAWFRALTIRERLQILSRTPAGIFEKHIGSRAHVRLGQWRSIDPFRNQPETFERRLRLEDLTEEDILYALSAIGSAKFYQEREFDWLRSLFDAYLANNAALNPLGISHPQFMRWLAPLINRGIRNLTETIDGLDRKNGSLFPVDGVTFIPLALKALYRSLRSLSQRALILELNLSRLRGKLKARLAQDRCHEYFEALADPVTALRFLRDYPVLAKRIVEEIDRWMACSLELAQRLNDDFLLLQERFGKEERLGSLSGLQSGMGDPHNNGRTVTILNFANGQRVVYKPRSGAIDTAFSELVEFVNQRGLSRPLETATVVDRGAYCWCAFVEHSSCKDTNASAEFYHQQGEWLCILYVLDATDFHAENVIARGEDPIWVDIEAIMHPHVRRIDGAYRVDGNFGFSPGQDTLDFDALDNSVMRIGLLPAPILSSDKEEVVDFSGLATFSNQRSIGFQSAYVNSGTDEWRIVAERTPLPKWNNLPTVDEKQIGVHDHPEALIKGFEEAYHVFLEHKTALDVAKGPLRDLADSKTRVVLRDTRRYSKMIQESSHPDLLRDAVDWQIYVDKLWGGLDMVPALATIVPEEIRALWRCDVPYFTANASRPDLLTGSGELVVSTFFRESGIACVQRRIENLGIEDLERQQWIISAALAATSRKKNFKHNYNAAVVQDPSPDDWLLLAQNIGDRLLSRAIMGGGRVTWLGLEFAHEKVWRVAPLVPGSFYSGTIGVILFLAYLSHITGKPKYREIAEGAFGRVRHLIDQTGDCPPNAVIGAFEGLGGYVYVLTHLSFLWNDKSLLEMAERIAALIGKLAVDSKQVDLVAGTAGALLSLYVLHEYNACSAAEAAIDICANHLVNSAVVAESGLRWTAIDQESFVGFAHGSSGIVLALLRASKATRNARYRAIAESAIMFQRNGHSAGSTLPAFLSCLDAPNDQRLFAKAKHRTDWCHGASGIGLARLAGLDILDDGAIRGEIMAATRLVLDLGFEENHCLCHGDFGNLLFLKEAARSLNNESLSRKAKEKENEIYHSMKMRGLLCGTPPGTDSPGLMIGLAGIGFASLLLAEPRRVPLLIALEGVRKD